MKNTLELLRFAARLAYEDGVGGDFIAHTVKEELARCRLADAIANDDEIARLRRRLRELEKRSVILNPTAAKAA